MKLWFAVLCACLIPASRVAAQEPLVHGLWVWKTALLFDSPAGRQALRDFCQAQRINEVYLSFSTQNEAAGEQQEMDQLIDLLHKSHIRAEALLSSTDADEPGKHRDKLMAHVNDVLSYNRQHARARFDGIHLDIEPQQRPENKGPGNLVSCRICWIPIGLCGIWPGRTI